MERIARSCSMPCLRPDSSHAAGQESDEVPKELQAPWAEAQHAEQRTWSESLAQPRPRPERSRAKREVAEKALLVKVVLLPQGTEDLLWSRSLQFDSTATDTQ